MNKGEAVGKTGAGHAEWCRARQVLRTAVFFGEALLPSARTTPLAAGFKRNFLL